VNEALKMGVWMKIIQGKDQEGDDFKTVAQQAVGIFLRDLKQVENASFVTFDRKPARILKVMPEIVAMTRRAATANASENTRLMAGAPTVKALAARKKPIQEEEIVSKKTIEGRYLETCHESKPKASPKKTQREEEVDEEEEEGEPETSPRKGKAGKTAEVHVAELLPSRIDNLFQMFQDSVRRTDERLQESLRRTDERLASMERDRQQPQPPQHYGTKPRFQGSTRERQMQPQMCG
jgi:hypothetical protein